MLCHKVWGHGKPADRALARSGRNVFWRQYEYCFAAVGQVSERPPGPHLSVTDYPAFVKATDGFCMRAQQM